MFKLSSLPIFTSHDWPNYLEQYAEYAELTENIPQHFCSQPYQFSPDDNGGSMFFQKSVHLTKGRPQSDEKLPQKPEN
jgi:hypothetical protein